MKYRGSRLAIAALLMMLCFALSAVAAHSAIVVYLDEYGAQSGYQDPNAYDAMSALTALASPPKMEVAGKALNSGILPGTKVLGIKTVGDTTIIDFSIEIIGAGLNEARMSAIFDQVKSTLFQFGFQGNIRVDAAGKPLSDYVPVVKSVEPSPEALRDLTLRSPGSSAPIVGVGLGARKITVSPGHGWMWNGSGWHTQRPVYCSPLNEEDFHTLEICQYLETYLAQDGATVKMVRCTDKNYGNTTTYSVNHPWWQMGAEYWLKEIGYPCSVYGPDGCNLGSGTTDSGNDITSRPLASDYDASDIYLSVHTNGYTGDCTGSCPTGTATYYDASSTHAAYGTVSHNLATAVHNAMIDAVHTKYSDSGWSSRGVFDSNGAYGEIRVPSRAAILAELAFHDSCDTDAVKLRDNFFRSTLMWSMYKGVCDYFGTTPTWDYYSCEVVSNDIPTSMSVGENRIVHVTLRNRGVLWNDAKSFHLGAVGDSDPFTTTTRQTISGEVGPNTTYTYTFNLKAPNAVGTFTTDWRMIRDGYTWFGPTITQNIVVTGVPDNEAPSVPANLSGISTSPVRINLTWDASTDNIGIGGYNIYRDNVKIGSSATTSYSDATCAANTTYSYEVTAYDAVPNESGRSVPAVVTSQAGDTSPPTVPTNFKATGFSMTQIDLSWTASTDNVAVTGYKIYRNGAYLASTTGTSYSNTGLSQGQTNTYTVSAYDAAANESAQSASSTATSWLLVYQDGFPDTGQWVADTVADTTVRGGAYDSSKNHATYTGAGTITTTAGTSGTNGCFSYHSLGSSFTSGRVEAYYYDSSGTAASRQGIWLRCYNGTSLAGWTYLGLYSPTNSATYHASAGNSWGWINNIMTRPTTAGWRNFRTDIMPSGTGAVKFYIDGALKATAERFTALDNYGISRISIGQNYNVTLQGWYDDIQFSVPAPNAPTVSAPSSVTINSIRWNFTDNADSENAFVLHDSAETQKGAGAKNAAYITESSLAANTLYTRHVHGKNGSATGPASADMSKYTLSVAPTTSTVTCDKPTNVWQSDSEFTFTATGGFGAGKVQYYKYAWDMSASHTWTGTENLWDGGGVVSTIDLAASDGGNWYLHVKGYNAEGVENGTLNLGPFKYDNTGPSAATVTDEGAYTPSTSELKATISATDAESGITAYQYTIGTSAGGTEISGWTPSATANITASDLTLSAGNTYFISGKAQNAAGAWGDPGNSDGIEVVADTGKVQDAKKKDNTGNKVALLNKAVTANFGDHLYIQEPGDGFSGIRVDKGGFAQGSFVSVAGLINSLTSGERIIQNATVKAGTAGVMPHALMLLNKYIGGESLNDYTPGITGTYGPNNVGLLVTVTGKLTKTESGYWFVDDGSTMLYDAVIIGIPVDTSQLSAAKKAELATADNVVVTGICQPGTVNALIAPVVKLRGDGDIVYYR